MTVCGWVKFCFITYSCLINLIAIKMLSVAYYLDIIFNEIIFV